MGHIYIHTIKKLLKYTTNKIAFKTNAIKNILNITPKTNKYDNGGILNPH
jgi:hypothetical protein